MSSALGVSAWTVYDWFAIEKLEPEFDAQNDVAYAVVGTNDELWAKPFDHQSGGMGVRPVLNNTWLAFFVQEPTNGKRYAITARSVADVVVWTWPWTTLRVQLENDDVVLLHIPFDRPGDMEAVIQTPSWGWASLAQADAAALNPDRVAVTLLPPPPNGIKNWQQVVSLPDVCLMLLFPRGFLLHPAKVSFDGQVVHVGRRLVSLPPQETRRSRRLRRQAPSDDASSEVPQKRYFVEFRLNDAPYVYIMYRDSPYIQLANHPANANLDEAGRRVADETLTRALLFHWAFTNSDETMVWDANDRITPPATTQAQFTMPLQPPDLTQATMDSDDEGTRLTEAPWWAGLQALDESDSPKHAEGEDDDDFMKVVSQRLMKLKV